jgi:acyl-CoA reductase-like NAD-dependent aldehyde dehydrogenase
MSGDYDCGAMTMGPNEIDRILGLVNKAVAQGARLLAGGKRNENYMDGAFMVPTLLVDVTKDMVRCSRF